MEKFDSGLFLASIDLIRLLNPTDNDKESNIYAYWSIGPGNGILVGGGITFNTYKFNEEVGLPLDEQTFTGITYQTSFGVAAASFAKLTSYGENISNVDNNNYFGVGNKIPLYKGTATGLGVGWKFGAARSWTNSGLIGNLLNFNTTESTSTSTSSTSTSSTDYFGSPLPAKSPVIIAQ